MFIVSHDLAACDAGLAFPNNHQWKEKRAISFAVVPLDFSDHLCLSDDDSP